VPAVLGVDLGATNLRVALGDERGIVAREAMPVPATGAELAEHVAAAARRLGTVAAAGVGVPGIPAGDGFAGLIAGAAGLSAAPIQRLLADALGVPVVVENDLNLAALAEHRARAVDDLAFIGVGTGVGMGIVAGGRLVRGAHGAAGELGQLPTGDQIVAPPDHLGPLEAIAGGAGLAARWGSRTARDVFAAADRGDARARALLDDQLRVLATAVRAVQALLDPELVVLGGGIGCRPGVADRVRTALAAQGTPAPPVEVSRLGEDAGLLGALLVATR
jgi:glucokinase